MTAMIGKICPPVPPPSKKYSHYFYLVYFDILINTPAPINEATIAEPP